MDLDGLLQDAEMGLIITPDADYFLYYKDGAIVSETFAKGKTKDKVKVKTKVNEVVSLLSPEQGLLDEYLETAIQMYEEDNNPFEDPSLTTEGSGYIRALTMGFVGERGRAIYVLSVLMAAIKLVKPDQDIRLHKARWVDGINMRTIDKLCITAWFNSRNLGVKLNTDGSFMTRALAENYPYVSLYQADIKGPKDEWLGFIHGLQSGVIDPSSALRALLFGAHLRQIDHLELVDEVRKHLSDMYTQKDALDLISSHIRNRSNGGARLLELAIHSLLQIVYEAEVIIPCLKEFRKPAPIKPMRSPDKKAGDIADIQFRHSKFEDTKGQRYIEYGIDAKHNIPELGPELTRLITHIEDVKTPQLHLQRFDFVGLDYAPEPSSSADTDMRRLQSKGIEIKMHSVGDLLSELDFTNKLASQWVHRYISMIAGEDRGYGKVTEVTTDWL